MGKHPIRHTTQNNPPIIIKQVTRIRTPQRVALSRLPHHRGPRRRRTRSSIYSRFRTRRPRPRLYIHPHCPILVGDSQSSRCHRIPRSCTGVLDRFMILRNRIRPQIKRKTSRRKARLILWNSYLPRSIIITVITGIANPARRSTRQTRPCVHPICPGSSTGVSRDRHSQISGRRRSRRRLQSHNLRTAVLPHRSNRIARAVNKTQRNRRLRPHRGRSNRQNRQDQSCRQRQQTQPSHRLASILRSAGRPVNRPDAKNATPPPQFVKSSPPAPAGNAPDPGVPLIFRAPPGGRSTRARL